MNNNLEGLDRFLIVTGLRQNIDRPIGLRNYAGSHQYVENGLYIVIRIVLCSIVSRSCLLKLACGLSSRTKSAKLQAYRNDEQTRMLRMLRELNASITQENMECSLQMNDYPYLYYSMEQSREQLF